MLLTAGAAEAFVLLARALKVRRPVVVHPQFTEPEAALRDAGHAVDRVLLREEDGFRLDPAAVPEDADLVVIGNPTNPTSVLHPAARIARLARPGRTLVVDEAFMDAVPGEREALAGRTRRARAGGAAQPHQDVGAGGAADRLRAGRSRRPSRSWSGPSRCGRCPRRRSRRPRRACRRGRWRRRRTRRTGSRRTGPIWSRGCAEFAPDGLRVAGPAEGPFVLVRLPRARGVRRRLRDLGFAVRRGDTFPGLGTDWLRLAVRDRATTNRFLQALDQALTSA